MKPEELPYGDSWKIPHKHFTLKEGMELVFFNIAEVSMMNEMGNIAIVKGGTVIYKSKTFYYSWGKPVILNESTVVLNYSKKTENKIKRMDFMSPYI